MLDKTIDSALANLRRDLIRSGGDGLEHVEALMRLRGVPMPRVMPPKKPDAARYGQMRRLIYAALRDGPRTAPEIARVVAASPPEITPEEALKRTWNALSKMKHEGLVGREGRVWRLARK